MREKSMKNTTHPSEHYSSDRFSAQFANGFKQLLFTPSLETEYRQAIHTEQRQPALFCAITGLIIWVSFGVSDIYRMSNTWQLSGLDFPTWLVLIARWIGLAGLLLALHLIYRNNPRYGHINQCVYILLGIGIGITSGIIKAKGSFAMESAQILIVMAAFLPIGLTFRQALAATVIVMVCALILPTVLPISTPDSNIEFMVMMPLATLIAALGGYAREYAHREQFLLRGILRHQASTDALTGLANRREFAQHAERALKQGQRTHQTVLLALIDIDHFKRYNDHYGHRAGDDTLRCVAQALQQAISRPMDLAARVGGEEFALLFYDTPPSHGVQQLQTICQSISALAIPHSQSEYRVVTISAGLAQFDSTESLDMLYQRADEMLYAAKKAGRNQAYYVEHALASISEQAVASA
jgi:diguanylate cyclase (GGDEF)-like protein